MVLYILLCLAAMLRPGAAIASTDTHAIVINLPEFRLYHYVGGVVAKTYPISIGHINSQTPVSSPTRRFEIYTKVINPWWKSPTTGVVMPPGPTNPLGTRWLGLMTIDKVTLNATDTWDALARRYGISVSSILTHNGLPTTTKITPGMIVEVPHSDGYGIHGTIVPSSIGTPVSLGCMRMLNSDVERLYDNLPSGKRIAVTINYEPLAERVDALTGEIYHQVFYDVYRRLSNWPDALAAVVARTGAQVTPWMQSIMQEKFVGSYLLSKSPGIENNGKILGVGAKRVDNTFFIPTRVLEQLLGEVVTSHEGVYYLGERALSSAEIIEEPNILYCDIALIKEITGKGHYYEPFVNLVQFSITRLVMDGSIRSYNRVFLHETLGPMITAGDIGEVVGAEVTYLEQGRVVIGGIILQGETFGRWAYIPAPELHKLGFTYSWSPASGELALTSAQVVIEP